jgi:hypothetical protein
MRSVYSCWDIQRADATWVEAWSKIFFSCTHWTRLRKYEIQKGVRRLDNGRQAGLWHNGSLMNESPGGIAFDATDRRVYATGKGTVVQGNNPVPYTFGYAKDGNRS